MKKTKKNAKFHKKQIKALQTILDKTEEEFLNKQLSYSNYLYLCDTLNDIISNEKYEIEGV